MTDIVLVAGAYHGGWYFDPILPALTREGHRVFTPTLPGLELDHLPHIPVNLETHVQFLIDLLDEVQSDDVVLVGHSYGGMVITGAAARNPARIRRMIYLDAPVPENGQRVWDLIPAQAREDFVAASPDGFLVHPVPELKALDSRIVAQPVATLLQPLDAPTEVLTMPRTFVVAKNGTAFRSVYDRLVNEPGWECLSFPTGHDFLREAPDELADMLLEILR